MPEPTKHDRRWWADVVSRVVAAIVLAVGITAVVWPYVEDRTFGFDDPRETRTLTTTVKTSSRAAPSMTKTVVTTGTGPAKTTRVTTRKGAVTVQRTTVAAADDSLLERALSGTGLLFVQLGLVFVAAFLAGGIAQRVWVGSFGIKLPFVELSDLPAAATASITALDEIRKGLNDQIASLTVTLNERFEQQADETAMRTEALASVALAVSDVEERLGRLESRHT